MQETFAYYDGTRWVGGFASRQEAVQHSIAGHTEVRPDSLLSVWIPNLPVLAPRRRQEPQASVGSMASFLALGQ